MNVAPPDTLDTVLHHICSVVWQLFDAAWAAIVLEREADQCSWAATGEASKWLAALPSGLLDQALHEQRVVRVLERSDDHANSRKELVLAPYRVSDDARGCLAFNTSQGSSPSFHWAARAAANYAARQIANFEQAEKAARLDAIIDQMPSGVLVIDLDGRVRLRNAAGQRISGTNATADQATDIRGFQAYDLNSGKPLDRSTSPLDMALQGRAINNFEYGFRRGALPDVVVRASYRPLLDAAGRLSGTVMVYSDVTHERQLTKDLADREAHLRSLYDKIACGIVVREANGSLLYANSATYSMLRADPRQADPFRGWKRVDHEGNQVPFDAVSRVVTARQAMHDQLYSLLSPDGEPRWFRIDAVPTLDDGGRVGEIVISMVDVTEDQRNEASANARAHQQAAVAELGQLAIKAPLEDVFDRAARTVKATLQVDCVTVGELAEGGASLLGRASVGWANPTAPNEPILLSPRSPTTAAMASNTPIIVEDYRDSEFTPPLDDRHPGIRSCLCVPIRLDYGVFGSIAAFAVRPRAFSADDIHFLSAVANIIGSAVDRARSRDALAANEVRYRGIVETSSEGVWTVDDRGRTTFVNQKMADMLGATPKQLLGFGMVKFVEPAHLDVLRTNLARTLKGVEEPGQIDIRFIRSDGSSLWTRLSTAVLRDGSGRYTGALAMVTDVSERRRAEEALAYQVLHDSLTGLPNRAALQDRLEQAVLTAKRDGTPATVMFIDLDSFKDVNDTMGHDKGDELLCQIGPRLREVLRESDTVARLGGDEFSVILPGLGQASTAAAVASKMLAALAKPFLVGGRWIEISGSLGIALCPEHGEDVALLLQHADIAMYVAKQQHNTFAVYAPTGDASGMDRLTLTAELRRTIEAGELQLFYQPKVSLKDGSVAGLEALVRWPHPSRGMVLPEDFIPLAERTGLIRPLSQWVLNTTLRQLAAWQREGVNVTAAVNLSMRDLREADLIENIKRLLADSGADPSWLSIEITETMIMADPQRTMAVVTALHQLGLRFCIDDFGTGYSSLSYLKDLPAQEIKIDKSFVMNLLADDRDASIVKSVIDLAHNLGRETVAEGVENADTMERLSAWGCDYVQGYHISRPMPVPQLAGWLAVAGCGPRTLPSL